MESLANFLKFKNNIAIILCDDNQVLEYKTYEFVESTCERLLSWLGGCVKEKSCIGLFNAKQHVVLLSIIASLNRLEQTFVFLNKNHVVDDSTIGKFGVQWVLTIDNETDDVCLNFIQFDMIIIENCAKIVLWRNKATGNSNGVDYRDIFCVMFTSGTTGDSKAVRVTNHCIEKNAHSIRNLFQITSADVIYWGTPLTFDPSLIELLITLQSGATLVILPEEVKANTTQLFNALFHHKTPSPIYQGISVLQMVPSVYFRWNSIQIRFMLNKSQLRCLAFGGETFPQQILDYDRRESLLLFNLYGITEVSCWAMANQIADGIDEGTEVVLGKPLDETIVEVRDELGAAIEFDGDGEIYIGSKPTERICLINNENWDDLQTRNFIFRATGDLGRKTAQKITYLGRKDAKLKRFGHWINLDYIEAVIFEETSLRNKCIWCESTKKLLVFACLDEPIDELKGKKIQDKLRVKLLHVLPEEAQPDLLEILAEFPLNCHGKIDKKQLELLYLNTMKSSGVKNAVDTFRDLCCEFLGITQSQIDANSAFSFRDFGGSSISATQLLRELQEKLQNEEQVQELTNLVFGSNMASCLNFLQDNFVNVELEDNSSKDGSGALEVVWKYDMKACVDSTPMVYSKNGRKFACVGSYAHIFATVDDKGHEEHRVVLPDVVEGTACISTCASKLFVGCFDGKMYCIDVDRKVIAWEYSTGNRIKCTPYYSEELAVIVFGSYDKFVHCVDVVTGKCIWRTPTSESVSSNPLVIPNSNKIYIATIMGKCLCLELKTGEIIWTYLASSPIFGAPCSFTSPQNNHFIIWPDAKGKIHCVDALNGKRVWTYQTDGFVYSAVVHHKAQLYFGCTDRHFYILDSKGNLLQKIRTGGCITTTPYVFDSPTMGLAAVICCNSGKVCLVDVKNGSYESLQLPGKVFSSPVVSDDKIFVGCRDDHLYCILMTHK